MSHIHIYRPTIKRKDLEYVLNCMILDKVDYGDFAKNFEKRLKNRTNINNTIVVNSFFNSLTLILEALNPEEGDEIILPSFLPQIYLNVIKFKKMKPVLVDLEKNYLKPSIESVKNAVNKNTKAVILPYYFGFSYDPEPYTKIFPTIIEDITSVIGYKYEDIKPGSSSAFAVADFSKRGIITTGEGACIFCSNRSNYKKVFSLLEIDYDIDYSPKMACLMPDLNAAMGVSQDETLNHRLKLRETIGKIYEESVKRCRNTILIHSELEKRYYSEFPVLFKSGLKQVIKFFNKQKIEAVKPYAYPLHHYLNLEKKDFPNTEYYYLNTLLIPIYSSLLKKNVDNISKVIASIL